MSDADQNQLIAGGARAIVRQVAPEELLIYQAQCQRYFADPTAVLLEKKSGERGKDQMLGFGAGGEVALYTPIILNVMSTVVVFLEGEITKSLKEESPTVARALLRHLLRLDPSGSPPEGVRAAAAPIAADQLRRVRQAAYEQAKRCHVSDDRANLLADAIVGQLAAAGA
jgi:hypothetical protein